MDERLKELLKELGDALNEAISGSSEVNEQIQKIRDEGYDLYVILDATIGVERAGEEGEPSTAAEQEATASAPLQQRLALPGAEVQFRINVNDLAFLRSVGIDPTRKMRKNRS